MPLDTNISSSPYFDDYDEFKNYYKVLYKPSVAVQTRELNQTQSILQSQIEKIGRNIFKEGSVVEGCSFNFDNNYQFVKLSDSYANGALLTPSQFNSQVVYNTNGLKAVVVNSISGFVSADALSGNTNTIFVKYLNSATFANGTSQKVFSNSDVLTFASTANVTIGQVNVANVAVPIGTGYSVHITKGIIFKKGMFLNVVDQTTIVAPYSNVPDNVSLGFQANESIVSALSDPTLYDNANGSTNYSAPGADRLKVDPVLIVRNTNDITNSNTFFSIADFKLGNPVTVKQDPQFSSIGAEMARRTFETNGNFVVKPFITKTSKKLQILNANNVLIDDPLTTQYLNLLVSQGEAYVEGYRVNYINNNITNIRRSTDFANNSAQIISANFGNYVYVNEISGEFGDLTKVIQVNLYSDAKTSITSGSLLNIGVPSTTTLIGTAYVRAIAYDSGTLATPSSTYRLYLFNISMNSGYSFSTVKSIAYVSAGSLVGICDVIPTYTGTANTYTTQLQSTTNFGMIFPFGQKALKTNGFTNTQFQYRRKNGTGGSSTTVQSNGTFSFTIPPASGGSETFPYLGLLSGPQENDFYITVTSPGNSANKSGTVNLYSNGTVLGTSTTFNSDFVVGDYILANTQSKLITSVVNNTFLTCASGFSANVTGQTYAKSYPVGAIIPFANRNNRTITTSNTVATFSIGETVAAPFNVDIFYTVNRTSTVPVKKIINKSVFVKIDCSAHPAGKLGPWSLGVPDIYSLDGIYVGVNGNYDPTSTNLISSFSYNNGQRDTHYDLGTLSVLNNIQLTSASTILVKMSVFTYDYSAGKGLFLSSSYPIDDVSTANNNAITTSQIPVYVNSFGTSYDLRDCVDFRPFASNTAIVSNNYTIATINPSANLTLTSGGASYLPAPDSVFQTDLQYYLSRVDRIVLDTTGALIVNEGLPDVTNPQAPVEKSGTMTIAIATIPPYPSLSSGEAVTLNRSDYSVSINNVQQRRWTMKDISSLNNRISNIEYYTSLSLLEQKASTLQVRSSATGQNRFQNGFFADPFNDLSFANMSDNQFLIALDSAAAEIRPAFTQTRNGMIYDTVRSTTQQHGELIMLPHTSNTLYISQPFASTPVKVNQATYTYTGSINLVPPGTLAPDISTSAEVIGNIEQCAPWIQLGKTAWSTDYGNWVGSTIPLTGGISNYVQGSDQTPFGGNLSAGGKVSADNSGRGSTITNSVSTTQQRAVNQISTAAASSTVAAKSVVTGVSILPFLKATNIKFFGNGFKPNTTLYAYFGNLGVSATCAPITGYDSSNNAITGTFGSPLVTSNTGSVSGVFYLPPNTFPAQQNDFILNDVNSLSFGAAATTQGIATYYGSTLSIQSSNINITTRPPVVVPPVVIPSTPLPPITYVSRDVPTYSSDFNRGGDRVGDARRDGGLSGG